MELKQFFSQVLSSLNIPVSEGAIQFLITWSNFEKRAAGRPHGFNPLNTTKDLSRIDKGQTNFNRNNGYPVKSYSTQEFGVKATADTLKLPYYKNIVAALKAGAPPALAYQKKGIAREIRTWGSHTFANKFIDAADSKKKTVIQAKKEDNSGKIITVLVILFAVGISAYYITNNL